MPSKKKGATKLNAAKPEPLADPPQPTPASAAASQQSLQKPAPRQLAADGVNGQVAPTTADPDVKTGDTTESAGEPPHAPSVNRKKQKRREKEAAKRAAERDLLTAERPLPNGHPPNGQLGPVKGGRGPIKGYFTEGTEYVDPRDPTYPDIGSPEEAFYSGEDDPSYHEADQMPDSSWLNTSKRKKSKTKGLHSDANPLSRSSTNISRSHIPPLSNAAIRASHKMSNDQIWNTSTQAERENIKQFWLELGEDERRSLVKVEKEAVLRKMKEQQKHSCSCSVCGRKRTAIEEELEVLYDAYYEELEQFANHNTDLASAPQITASSRPPFRRLAHPMAGSYPTRGRVHEFADEDDDLDDEEEDDGGVGGDYDDEDEEEYSDDEGDLDAHGLPPGPPDFFQFGNSLTVKDGILTVADDLLKNDGKHFIDMMEQLAERRMQRHNHPPIDDDDDYDDEDDDEDYDSQEDDDFEGDEMDSMTEEQRMEEGRRMFQIFAARMFEQRVLTAYREKVAAERQRKLLQELEEEDRLDTQREAKKAKEAAKKKEKKRLQKLAKDEEKAKKEAEKAAQEAAAREAEEKRLEEQRQRKEEQRKKREAEKKAADEEKARKEAERLRKQQEAREKHAEAEKRAREAKEKERQKREEAKKKEREERETREKEAKERKAREEKEKKEREDQARREREGVPKDNKPHQPAPKSQPVAIPPGLHPPQRGSALQSPHLPVATPIIPPKIPTPVRNRQPSQPSQPSHASSPRSQQASTEISRSTASPASVVMPHPPGPPQGAKGPVQQPILHHPQPSAPRSPLNNHGRGQFPFTNMNGLPGLGVVAGPPPGVPGMMPGMMSPMPMYQGPPPLVGNQRFAPNGLQHPPGFQRPFQPGHQMPFTGPPPPQGPPMTPQQAVAIQKPATHSRQPSHDNQPAPIARPGPIARPSSTTPDKQRPHVPSDAEVDHIATQLGSKALLDDSDDPFPGNPEPRPNPPPAFGPPGAVRLPFAGNFEPKPDAFGMGGPGWGSFNPGVAAPGWGPPNQRPGPGWSQPPFGGMPQPVQRSHLPRPIAVRLMLVQACRNLASAPGTSPDGYHPVPTALGQVNALKAPTEPPVSMDEMLGICDTEGNSQNGGGAFEVVMDKARGQVVKFIDDAPMQPRNSVGDIGSPLLNHSQHAPLGHFGGIGQNSFGPPGRSF